MVQWGSECTGPWFPHWTSALVNGWCLNQEDTSSGDDSGWFSLGVSTWTGRKSPVREPQNTAVIRPLLLTPAISTPFEPLASIVQVLDGTILTPIWSQLSINSTGISSISTVVTTSTRNCCFSCAKLAVECLLLAVVAFHWTKLHPSQKWVRTLSV